VSAGGEPAGSLPERSGAPDDATVELMRRRARARAVIRTVGLILGLALVGVAIWYASGDRRTMDDIAAALRDAPPARLFALAGCVLLNVALTGALFSVLISRYGRVGLVEMQAVTASTALLNFLPLRPGLFGRVAYHRLVNGIAIRDTAKVIVGSVLLTAIVTVCLLGAVVVAGWMSAPLWQVAGVIALVPIIAAAIDRRFRWAAGAFLLRLADILVWAARYVILFDLIGRPIGLDAAIALAAVSIFATMAPFISNGLGLREWAVGLAAPVLVDTFGGTIVDGRIAVAAELIHRGVELLMIGAVGGAGLAWLAARRRAAHRVTPD
jgi:hypothetical protein